MKKIFAFFAAMLVACAVNATETQLNPGSGVLYGAVAAASAGDVLVLADGVYEEPEVVNLDKNITIKAADGAHPIVAQQYYMKLLSSAQVTFIGIKFDGGLYKNGQGANDHCIRPYDDSNDKALTLIDCEFCNWKSYILYPQRSNRRMQSMTLNGCYFHDNAKGAIYVETAPAATDPLPLAVLNVTNTTFSGTPSYKPIDLKNSGSETADAQLRVDHCTFYNCGTLRSEKSTDVIINNSIFAAPEGASYTATTLYAGAVINNCLTFNVAFNSAPTQNACIVGDPLFRDAASGDLRINAGSPVYGAGNDGSDLGDPRWLPHVDYYLVGSMTGWGLNTSYKLMKNPENDAEYMISMTLYAADQFKIVSSDGEAIGTWYPDGMDNNFIAAESGEYTVYFRPDGQGGSDWHYGYIYAAKKAIAPWETWFGDANGAPETNSYLAYNEAAGKATVYIRDNKNAQWKAQVKYHGTPAEEGKCYHVTLKMKANHDIGGVTIKWQDDNNDPNLIYENQTISLAEEELFIYDAVVAGIPGNGILVLDFGYAQAGDIIEIYNPIIEETVCPEPVEIQYYLVGTMSEWGAEEQYLFAPNPEAEGEFMLNAMLPEGAGIKVVGVAGEDAIWYPEGIGNEYVVDAAHAGWATIYFRPAGNAEWAEFGGYFYINARQGIDNVQGDNVQCTKVIENGQLIILKNGMKYNAQGALVK
ncbi:MAG: DUF5123 domain-containing protein [Paludibacteraceae bacterium]|nr:DUF5123 domain-containing protein [Paludibacteraceae bacterium]